jgi:hypothetical protein
VIECIHGLDEELGDLCSPRQRPELPDPVVPVRKAPAARKAPARVPGAKRVGVEVLPDFDLANMRVHHWTHVSNVEGILAEGRIRAGATPELDVSSPETREKREAVTVPSGAAVSAHVPFALSPDASTWNEVRSGAAGEHWSDAARSTKATDFVVLVAPVASLDGNLVVADVDATAPLARFAAGIAEGGALVRRASLADPELLAVEILVPDSVDLSAVTLIGVPNDKMRDRVKALVNEAGGAKPRVAVYPPWFRPSPQEA